MSRTMMRLAFFVLFTMSRVLSGAEEKEAHAASFVLKAGSGTVDVHRPDGSLLQSLPYAGVEPDERNLDSFAFVRDMNFDGSPDVAVLHARGAQNVFYDCWLWREDAGSFVKYEYFNEVPSPDFDPERKRVNSYAHVSATDNVTAEYAWKDGTLVLVERIAQRFSPESETFTISRYVRSDDGEMRLAKEKTLSAKEMEALSNGGEYRRLEERLPMWLGEFRNGDLTLDISIYSPGRMGMYFEGVFSGEGKEPWRIRAAVEGRKAEGAGEDLSFTLSDDDSTITVAVGETGDAVTLERVVGDDDGAVTGVPFVNTLGFDIEAVYAHAPGHKPWKIAGPLADGESAKVDASSLRGSRRLIVKNADDEDEKAPPLQFFTRSYMGGVERMELTLSAIRKEPLLLTVEDGELDAAIAGLPFDILLSFLESEDGLDAGQYAELMTPLAADGWEEYPCAVVSGGMSWSLLSPGPVFREKEDGVRRLSGIALAARASQDEFIGFLGEFEGYESISRERGDQRVFLESPRAFYEVRFDPEMEAVELRFTRKSDDAAALSAFDAVLTGLRRGDSGREYALHDIDANGTDELFVFSTDGSGEYTLYSHANGETHDLGTFWPRHRLLFGEDGTLLISGSSGAGCNTLEKARISSDGTRLEILETWEMNEDVYTHSTTEVVSKSVWDAAWAQFSNAADAVDSLNCLPLPMNKE